MEAAGDVENYLGGDVAAHFFGRQEMFLIISVEADDAVDYFFGGRSC